MTWPSVITLDGTEWEESSMDGMLGRWVVWNFSLVHVPLAEKYYGLYRWVLLCEEESLLMDRESGGRRSGNL